MGWRRLQTGALVLVTAIVLAGAARFAAAQDGAESGPEPETLMLIACDPARPVFFQALAAGGEAALGRFSPQIALPLEDDPALPRIYIAIENTGWSQGALGWISARLDAETDYVAVELRDLGMAGYALREDGRALLFELHYDPALIPADPDEPESEPVPGFRLDLLTGQAVTFRVFRVVHEGGLLLTARRNTLSAAGARQERVQVLVDPQPVFGDLIFEVHIQALPAQIPTFTPSPVPEAIAPLLAAPAATPEAPIAG